MPSFRVPSPMQRAHALAWCLMPVRKLPRHQVDARAELASLVKAMTPDELEAFASHLLDEDRVLLERVLAEELQAGWRADPASMAHHFDANYRTWRYISYLSGKFVDAVEGRDKRQIWNLGSRYGKSHLLWWGLIWLLDRSPESRSIYVSYGQTLAREGSIYVRDQLRTHSAELRTQLKADQQRQDRFRTDSGGGLLAAGIHSAIIGFGAGHGGGLILDDPMKSWMEAHSEHKRKVVWDQYRGTLSHRLDDDNAFVIVAHARWHEDDISGRLIKGTEDETGEEWTVVSLPTLAMPGDVLGRAEGEVLEEEKFNLTAVKARHKAMGSHLVNALEQQSPAPEEGGELKRAWFRIEESDLPAAPGDDCLTSWDLKLKDKEAGDYVVGQAWVRAGADYFLIDQIRGQFDHAATANAIALLAVRHPEIRRHVIEAAGSADDVMPMLRKARPDYVVTPEMAGRLGMNRAEATAVEALRRRGMSNLVANPPKGDKSVRARAHIVPAAEAGNVHLAGRGWTAHLLDELASFPDGAHDDQVDAMSQALFKLGRAPATATAPTGNVRPPTPKGQVVRRASVRLPGR